MNSWLHWIGKSFYSINKFIDESVTYGITRRISLREAEKMNFGDWVYLIQKKGSNAGGSVFGRFKIDKISGLDIQTIQTIELEMEPINDGGRMVIRECGMYIEGPEYGINSTLSEIIIRLKEKEIKPKSLMIGGMTLEVFNEPWAILLHIPHRMGFRLFDGKRFYEAYQRDHALGLKPIIYRNDQFYADLNTRSQEIGGGIQAVIDYKKA